MSPSMAIQHFTHIHPLTKVDGQGGFMCNGCNTYGFGTTYRCVTCDYDLHDHCATCPPTLLSFMHPQHELQRVFRGPDQRQHNRRMCDICDKSVEGLYYHCEPCDFDVHPLCTQLPQYVRYVPHPDHYLELSYSGASNTCEVCRGAIQSWRYNCSLCRLDVHMGCVNSSASAGPVTQERYIASQPQFHHCQYNQPYYNQGYTNQGQIQKQQRGFKRRKMFRTLMKLTFKVVCTYIVGHA